MKSKKFALEKEAEQALGNCNNMMHLIERHQVDYNNQGALPIFTWYAAVIFRSSNQKRLVIYSINCMESCMNKFNALVVLSIVAATSIFAGIAMDTPVTAQDNMSMSMDNSSMPMDHSNMTMGMDNSTSTGGNSTTL